MKAQYHLSISSIIVGALVIVFGVEANAQHRIRPVISIGDRITCHVGGRTYERRPNKELIYHTSYAPTFSETQEIFEKIAEYTELRSNVYTVPVKDEYVNVEICPSDVDPEEGVARDYIVYNPTWLKSVYDETNNLWSVYAIIAHEIGHYANAHDRKSVGSVPKLELEADEYAGEILARMGACLSDAQAAYHAPVMQRSERSHTHPPIAERLAYVRKGWARFGKTCAGSEVPSSIQFVIDDWKTAKNVELSKNYENMLICKDGCGGVGQASFSYQFYVTDSGRYNLIVTYANNDPENNSGRPVDIYVNGVRVLESKMLRRTGGWHKTNAQDDAVGTIDLKEGENTIVFKPHYLISHISAIRLEKVN